MALITIEQSTDYILRVDDRTQAFDFLRTEQMTVDPDNFVTCMLVT